MNRRVRAIEELVARYVAAHPHAADTVEGIRTWWIAADMPDTSRAEVQASVDRLVGSGTLSRTALPEGGSLFSRAAPTNGHSNWPKEVEMPVLLTFPGVYIQELPSGVRSIIGVSTSLTAFIGRALRGSVGVPTPVGSYADFNRFFGGLWVPSTLGYAVAQFFNNGGSQGSDRPCA